MTSISNILKQLTSIFSNLNHFHTLEAVDRVSETQLQVGENSNWIIWQYGIKGEKRVLFYFSFIDSVIQHWHTTKLSAAPSQCRRITLGKYKDIYMLLKIWQIHHLIPGGGGSQDFSILKRSLVYIVRYTRLRSQKIVFCPAEDIYKIIFKTKKAVKYYIWTKQCN